MIEDYALVWTIFIKYKQWDKFKDLGFSESVEKRRNHWNLQHEFYQRKRPYNKHLNKSKFLLKYVLIFSNPPIQFQWHPQVSLSTMIGTSSKKDYAIVKEVLEWASSEIKSYPFKELQKAIHTGCNPSWLNYCLASKQLVCLTIHLINILFHWYCWPAGITTCVYCFLQLFK